MGTHDSAAPGLDLNPHWPPPRLSPLGSCIEPSSLSRRKSTRVSPGLGGERPSTASILCRAGTNQVIAEGQEGRKEGGREGERDGEGGRKGRKEKGRGGRREARNEILT